MTTLGITVAGKGGTGKTVIAAVLARLFGRDGRSVLAVDCDSNPMLAISLGVPVAKLSEPTPIPTDFWMTVERPGTGRAAILLEHPSVLTERHGIAAPDNVTLLAGPVADNEGCTPAAGVRGMLGVMLGSHLFERVITDFEAGVDEPAWALGGLLNPADVLLVVATPSPVAITTARKIVGLARERGVPRVYGIANQVRSEADTAAVRDAFAALDVECVAVVPWDDNVMLADVHGRSPLEPGTSSPALDAIRGLATRLELGAAAAA